MSDLCKCGHTASLHHHGKSCTAILDGCAPRIVFCKCEQFRESNLTEEETIVMAKEKTRRVVKYEVTAKDGKDLLAKDNQSQAAAMYRALVAADKPLSIAECYAKCEGKMESGAAWERLGKNLNSTLFALRKAGMVKRVEERIVVKAAKANGSAKPKRTSKPRAAKQEPPTTAAERQEQAATA